MKYKFVNKAKNLTPDDIKAHMNFDTVVKGASIWAGFKLGSVLLKFGSKVTAAAVAGTSTVVVTAAVVVATNTDWLDSKQPETTSTPPPVEINEELPEEQVELLEAIPQKQEDLAEEKEPEPKQKKEDKPVTNPVKTTPKPVKPASAAEDDIESKDVEIKARPLPDLRTFLSFVYDELKYPVGVGDSTEGFVQVHFKVNKEGIAEDFKISKSLGEAFDREAIRVIKKFQNWQPGSFNGDAVDNFFTIKVTFQVK